MATALALPVEQTEKHTIRRRSLSYVPQTATLDQDHTILGHYARVLWDIQRLRVATGNRIGAMERESIAQNFIDLVQIPSDQLESIERDLNRHLEQVARRHPMAPWIIAQRGIGLGGFARLIAITGRLDRFETVSKLWKYLGLAVMDGKAQRMPSGVIASHTNCQGGHLRMCKPDCKRDHHPNCVPGVPGTAYSPQGKVICYQLAEAIVKQGKGGPYRTAYDLKKAYYTENRLDWTPKRRHRAAMRYAIKMLLKDMWIEWHRVVPA